MSASTDAGHLRVRPVAGRRDVTRFIRLPFRLRRDELRWVPPLISERRRFLDRSRNPFFEHAEAEYFLAERDGEVVGRISAQVDHRFNEFQRNDHGLFGFFEAEAEPEIADALFDAAGEWLAGRDRDLMLGPMDFTLNDECGLLVEGYEFEPMILQPWHPPAYRGLFERAGFEKETDLLMWSAMLGQLREGSEFHPLIHEAARKCEREYGVKIRSMRKRDFVAELRRFMDVYNSAWKDNWGFVPLTDNEVRFHAKLLKPVLDERWSLIAERDGEVVGAALVLPDVNQVLAKLNGRLLPLGWLKFLLGRRRIDRFRVFALGVKPEHQHTGIAAAFYVHYLNTASFRTMPGGEAGWILEGNEPMNRAMEGVGGKVVKRYRLFRRPLEVARPADLAPGVPE